MPKANRFRFTEKCGQKFLTSRLCQVLGVSSRGLRAYRTRSALNAESGAQTPLAAICAAGFLLLLAPFISYIPVPVMAGTILFAAWRLVGFAERRAVMNSRCGEIFWN